MSVICRSGVSVSSPLPCAVLSFNFPSLAFISYCCSSSVWLKSSPQTLCFFFCSFSSLHVLNACHDFCQWLFGGRVCPFPSLLWRQISEDRKHFWRRAALSNPITFIWTDVSSVKRWLFIVWIYHVCNSEVKILHFADRLRFLPNNHSPGIAATNWSSARRIFRASDIFTLSHASLTGLLGKQIVVGSPRC